MARYDYETSVQSDVLDWIRDSIAGGYINPRDYADRDELAEELNDTLWVEDSVTGNGSGSYTFNSAKAHECLTGNEDLLKDALEEFGCTEDSKSLVDHFLNGDWEWFDVTVRCYLLGQAIDAALEELEDLGEISYHYDDDDEGR